MMHKFSIRCPHIQNHYTLTWNMLLSFTLKYKHESNKWKKVKHMYEKNTIHKNAVHSIICRIKQHYFEKQHMEHLLYNM